MPRKITQKQKRTLQLCIAFLLIGITTLTLAQQLISNQVTEQVTLSGIEGSFLLTMESPFNALPVFDIGETVGLLKVERLNPSISHIAVYMEWHHTNSSIVLMEDMFDMQAPWVNEAWMTIYDESMVLIDVKSSYADSCISFPNNGIQINNPNIDDDLDIYYIEIGFDFTVLAPVGTYTMSFWLEEVVV